MTLGGSVVQHSHSLVHVVIGAFSQPGKYKVMIARTKSGAGMPLTSPPAKEQKRSSRTTQFALHTSYVGTFCT